MKKFWQLVSKKDLVFGVIIFLVVIVFSAVESANKINVDFTEEAVNVKSAKYSMSIPFAEVSSVELAEMPEAGEVIDGRDTMTIRTGIWSNDIWGEYHVCVIPENPQCIVVHLKDGRIFVFNHPNNEETTAVFEQFQNCLISAETSAE